MDLYDASGNVVERVVPRAKAEQARLVEGFAGPWMGVTFTVLINDNNEVLYHKRHPSKRFEPNMIDHAGGSIKTGETPEVAARREIKEEVGVEPLSMRLVARGVNPYGFYSFRYLGRTNEVPAFDPAEGEVIEAGYASIDRLLEMEEKGDKFVADFFLDVQLAGLRDLGLPIPPDTIIDR